MMSGGMMQMPQMQQQMMYPGMDMSGMAAMGAGMGAGMGMVRGAAAAPRARGACARPLAGPACALNPAARSVRPGVRQQPSARQQAWPRRISLPLGRARPSARSLPRARAHRRLQSPCSSHTANHYTSKTQPRTCP